MPKHNILDVIKATINEIQDANRNNPNEPTADPSVFDLLRDKLGDLDKGNKIREGDPRHRPTGPQQPESILDQIMQKIEEAQVENRDNPKQPTAPGTIFAHLRKKVDNRHKRRAQYSIRSIIQEYNLDVRRMNRQLLQQIQERYSTDRRQLDAQYAKFIHDNLHRQ